MTSRGKRKPRYGFDGIVMPLRLPRTGACRQADNAARIAQRPDILDQRRETVEHPFGTIKQWMNQGAFLMRGLEKVRAELSPTALAYNFRRVLNIVGLPKLIAALPA